jgi:two-component system sensor histidine kinase KdpD
LRHQVTALRETNEQTQALLALGRRLAAAPDVASVRREVARAMADEQHVAVVVLAPADQGGALVQVDASADAPALGPNELAAAQWAYDRRQSAGLNTDTLPGIAWRFLPLVLERDCFGVIGLQFGDRHALGSERLAAIEALVSVAVLALARTQLVTSLEQAKVAEETERLRSALLSSVSHDLRTPLASMIGAASSLRTLDRDLSPADRAELLEAVLSEGERLNRYIQNLLDMTRLGYGTLKLERDWVGVDDLVNAALRRTRELMRELRVVRDIADGLPLLYVHPALIEQALVNVIENAAKFSPAGGVIRIDARREDAMVRIGIADQGPGIPPEHRERVFDMFFTGGEGDRGRHGSGLGLAICNGMVGAHGGRIEALPGADGRGTEIAIYLPLIEPIATPPP